MLFTLFQICFEFLNMQIILHQIKFKWLDLGLILLIVIIIESIMLPIRAWEWIPELLLLGLSIYIRTHNWRAAIVVSIESILLITIVSQLTQLIIPYFSFSEAIPLTFFGISIIVSVILYIVTRYFLLPVQSVSTAEAGLISLAFLVIISYLKLFNHHTPTPRMILLGLGLVIVFGLIMFVLQIEYQRILNQKSRLKQQQMELISNSRYTREMEQHYDELRRFRHDYQNVMLSIDEYLKTADLIGLQNYYTQELRPKTIQLTRTKYELEDLARVKNKAIKSIIFNKLNYAQSQDVQVALEVQQPATAFNMEIVSLVVVLGILLDNAVEATVGQQNSWLHVVIVITEEEQIIIVKNSISVALPMLWKIEKKGFSTKGAGRGLGLNNLKNILMSLSQVSLATDISKTDFSQKLVIKSGRK